MFGNIFFKTTTVVAGAYLAYTKLATLETRFTNKYGYTEPQEETVEPILFECDDVTQTLCSVALPMAGPTEEKASLTLEIPTTTIEQCSLPLPPVTPTTEMASSLHLTIPKHSDSEAREFNILITPPTPTAPEDEDEDEEVWFEIIITPPTPTTTEDEEEDYEFRIWDATKKLMEHKLAGMLVYTRARLADLNTAEIPAPELEDQDNSSESTASEEIDDDSIGNESVETEATEVTADENFPAPLMPIYTNPDDSPLKYHQLWVAQQKEKTEKRRVERLQQQKEQELETKKRIWP
ncbi:hypothetical protein YB2330_003978 [Saitoella coloradoensis]